MDSNKNIDCAFCLNEHTNDHICDYLCDTFGCDCNVCDNGCECECNKSKE